MLEIRDIELKDVKTMMVWGNFEDPRYQHFNFPYTTQEEFSLWLMYKVNAFRLRTYGVFIEDQVIGFVSFKKINRLLSQAELGVIFDINQVSKGYGSEAISRCIELINLRKVYLYVSTFNDRAYQTYLKLGFTEVSEVLRKFENQNLPKEIAADRAHFEIKNDTIYGKYKKMEWIKANASLR
jgi:RimJ/RimL family protein N-acetyltransferase